MSKGDLNPGTVARLLGVPQVGGGAPDLGAPLDDDLTVSAGRFQWARALRLFMRRLLTTASLRRPPAIRRHVLATAHTDLEAEDAYEDAIRCRLAIGIAGQGGDPATVFEVLAHHR